MPRPNPTRKALYRRLFAYGKDPRSRGMMLAYMFHRLSDAQLRDIVDLLDHDPDCTDGSERLSRDETRRAGTFDRGEVLRYLPKR